MDALLDKIQCLEERLDEEVAGLKEEVVRNKLEMVKMEKELMNNKKKIKELEKEKTTPTMCECKPQIVKAMEETSDLKLKVAVFEREFEGVKRKGETLTKLQSLLNSFLLKGQWSTQIDIQMEKLQTGQKSLSDEVKALEVALADQQQNIDLQARLDGSSAGLTQLSALQDDYKQIHATVDSLQDELDKEREVSKIAKKDVEQLVAQLTELKSQQLTDKGERDQLLKTVDSMKNDAESKDSSSKEMRTKLRVTDAEMRANRMRLKEMIKEKQSQGATSITKESQYAEAPIPIQSYGMVIARRYHLSICEYVSVNDENGIFTCTNRRRSKPFGVITSVQPFTETCSSFSIQIQFLSSSKKSYVSIGVGPEECPNDPGVGHGSVGYYSDNGGIHIESGDARFFCRQCDRGDIMKCQLNLRNRKIHFFRNNVKVCTIAEDEFRPHDFRSLYACIGISGLGTEVKVLETEPWRK